MNMTRPIDGYHKRRLQEMESTYNDLSRFSTFELVAELQKRTGVDTIHVSAHQPYDIDTPDTNVQETGPATIFIVTD